MAHEIRTVQLRSSRSTDVARWAHVPAAAVGIVGSVVQLAAGHSTDLEL